MHALRLCLSVIDKTNMIIAKVASWAILFIIGATIYEVIRRCKVVCVNDFGFGCQ
jgi:TRAP-type mannitol/chloroaromatic compound transport system permease small subunit